MGIFVVFVFMGGDKEFIVSWFRSFSSESEVGVGIRVLLIFIVVFNIFVLGFVYIVKNYGEF